MAELATGEDACGGRGDGVRGALSTLRQVRWRAGLRAALRASLDDLVDLLWPRRCWLCGQAAEADLVCAAHRFPGYGARRRPREAEGAEGAGRAAEAGGGWPQAPPRCDRCAARIAPMLPDGTRCPDCRRRPPSFGRVLVLGDYRGGEPLREWVLAFKHAGRRDLAAVLGAALSERLRAFADAGKRASEPRWGSWVVPVPLHRWRRFERGYDQAALLAREVAGRTELTFQRALERVRATPPQGAPGAVSRRANVEGAFRVRRSVRARLRGRDVWLVDDVLTSGATASACARTLRAAGARRVDVLALARAAPHGADANRAERSPVLGSAPLP